MGILQNFRPSLSYHLLLSPLFCLFLSGLFRQVLLNFKHHFMRGPRKFCQRGSKFDNIFFFFFLVEGIEDPNTTIYRPLSACQ